MLEIKDTVKEMWNNFGGLISRLDMVEESICELRDLSVEISKTGKAKEKRKEKKREKGTRISKDCGTATCNGKTRRERDE